MPYNIRSRTTGRFVSRKNAEKIKKDFEIYGKTVTHQLEYHFATTASQFVKSLDKFSVPFDTGNLHDSIGIGILVNGRIKKWTGAGGLKYLARPKLITSYKMEVGRGERLKSRAYRLQHWGSFKGLIEPGKGTGKEYLEEIDSLIKTRLRKETEKNNVTFICFAAIPYSLPLNRGVGKGAYHKNWFFQVTKAFSNQVNNTIKYGFLSKEAYNKFKYLDEDKKATHMITLNVTLSPTLESPIIEI